MAASPKEPSIPSPAPSSCLLHVFYPDLSDLPSPSDIPNESKVSTPAALIVTTKTSAVPLDYTVRILEYIFFLYLKAQQAVELIMERGKDELQEV